MFWFFGHEACGILAPQPGIEPAPPALEGEVLTTGLPGKSLYHHFLTSCSILMHIFFIFLEIYPQISIYVSIDIYIYILFFGIVEII